MQLAELPPGGREAAERRGICSTSLRPATLLCAIATAHLHL